MSRLTAPLTAPELAQLTGKSRDTIWRKTRSGEIPAEAVHYVGNRAYYSVSALRRAGWLSLLPTDQNQGAAP